MEVAVRGDLDSAIRYLKRALEKDGIHRAIKLQQNYPNLTDRRRAKERAAFRRKLESERKRDRWRKHGRGSI